MRNIGTYGGIIHKTDKDFNIGETAEIIKNNSTPKFFMLLYNYPNPFNPETTIRYFINFDGNVIIKIYNMVGEIIKNVDHGYRNTGFHNFKWDGLNHSNKPVPGGVYIYNAQSDGNIKYGKMLLIK